MGNLSELERLARRLRCEDGCPWDREQTLQSLIPCLVEEVQELSDAMECGDEAGVKEELGDCLFVVVMMAVVAEQEGWGSVAECCEHVAEKMIRRHPHVFGDAECGTAAEVLEQWRRIKRDEADNCSSRDV